MRAVCLVSLVYVLTLAFPFSLSSDVRVSRIVGPDGSALRVKARCMEPVGRSGEDVIGALHMMSCT